MINFRHRHDWAPGCPDVWPSIILDMSVEVFVDEISICIDRIKQIVLLNVCVCDKSHRCQEQRNICSRPCTQGFIGDGFYS